MDERTDGQKDLKNLVVAFRNFESAPKNYFKKSEVFIHICENEFGRHYVRVGAMAVEIAEG